MFATVQAYWLDSDIKLAFSKPPHVDTPSNTGVVENDDR